MLLSRFIYFEAWKKIPGPTRWLSIGQKEKQQQDEFRTRSNELLIGNLRMIFLACTKSMHEAWKKYTASAQIVVSTFWSSSRCNSHFTSKGGKCGFSYLGWAYVRISIPFNCTIYTSFSSTQYILEVFAHAAAAAVAKLYLFGNIVKSFLWRDAEYEDDNDGGK